MKLSKKIRNAIFVAMSFAMIGSLTLTGCSDGSSDDDTTSITKEEQKPEDNKEEQKTEDNKEEQKTEDNKEEQKTEDNKEEQKPEDNKEEQKPEDNKEEQKTEDTNKTDPSETVTITLKSMELIYEKSGDNESVVFKQEITDAEQCKKFIKGNKIKVELDVNAINKSSDALTSDVIFEFIDGGSDVEWWKTITKEASKQTLTKDSKITWEVELTDDISKGDKSEAKVQKAVLFFKLDAETAKSDDKVYVNKDLPVEGGPIEFDLSKTAKLWGNNVSYNPSTATITFTNANGEDAVGIAEWSGVDIDLTGYKKIVCELESNGAEWVKLMVNEGNPSTHSADIDFVNLKATANISEFASSVKRIYVYGGGTGNVVIKSIKAEK